MRPRLVSVASCGGMMLAALATGGASAVENDPLPVPAAGVRASAVERYNEGVVHLLARRHAQAQRLFEQALALDDTIAEAHNNLAYVLRMQGRHNFESSLAHYDRAIALKPTLAQAYAYRAVLFMQQGDAVRARQDLERLRALDTRLAADLQRVIESSGSGGTDRGGIAGQYDY